MITTQQAADRLKVSRRRVLAMIDSGRLPASKFGAAWMIAERDLAKVRVRKTGRPPKKSQ